jgi:hypothetical protein
MSTVVELDLGEGHHAHALRIEGEMVCVLSPAARTDSRIQAGIRRFMQGQGVDCSECRGCPVGKAAS